MEDEQVTKQEARKLLGKNVKVEKHRIPYDVWSNSQLSIARHYGGCNLNGKAYRLDFKNCRMEPPKEFGGDPKYFPDLVEQ